MSGYDQGLEMFLFGVACFGMGLLCGIAILAVML